MPIDATLRLLDLPFESLFATFVFCMLRMLGLTYSFVAFGFAIGSSTMMRINFAFVLSLPVMVAHAVPVTDMALATGTLELVLLAAKEFAMGFGLGLLASSPFRALQHAGGIIDSFRGEADSGIQGPDHNPLQTMSMFYLVIAFSMFFGFGGLWKLVETLYATYDIWPITERVPLLYEGAASIALDALDQALQLALIIAAPIMILLATVEVILMGAVKLGKRFHLYELSFLIKNLLTILTLPLMSIMLIRVAEDKLPAAMLSINVMETYFP